MLVDSHCHLALPEFDADRPAVLARAQAAGVRALVDVGIGPGSWERTLALAAAETCVWAALGLHPNEAETADETTLPRLREVLAAPRVVAIGETGLDYHWQRAAPDTQRALFVAHLALARELDLPVSSTAATPMTICWRRWRLRAGARAGCCTALPAAWSRQREASRSAT